MRLSGNCVLVTGGSSGIGLAIAERLLDAGSAVIICGRREEKLREAKARRTEFHVRVADLSTPAGRRELCVWATSVFPRLNVLINNAGIQQRLALAEVPPWERIEEEIAINLEAPIHLSTLFIPHLAKQPRSAIWNVTSGLSFAPIAGVPVYCATKAALHSFTLSLRHQLAGTAIEVIEIIPPAVDTDLGGPGLHKFGVPIAELVDAVLPRVEAGEQEVAYGFAAQSSRGSRADLDAMFQRMNSPDRGRG
jgi:uncharacterized oxidoreductase